MTARALWTLARPSGALFVSSLPVVGYWLAFWDRGLMVPHATWITDHLLILAIWPLSHAATMWLNAALDRDEEGVLWGKPVKVPAGIEGYAYAALLLGVAAAALGGLAFALLVAGCALLSVLYSHPKTAWKGHALLGPVTNLLGYGLFSPLAGFALAGLWPSPRAWGTVLLLMTALGAAYIAAQAFQEREDRERGYRTFVALYGAGATLRLTRALLWLAFLGLFLMSALGYLPRLLLVGLLPFLWLDAYLRRWMREPEGGDSAWAGRFVVRLLVVGLVLLSAIGVDYQLQERAGGPRGGLGTERGHP